ncbi:hypothetical protein SPSYN_01145 [Sporotomaculum syntrophicum]|uniref:Uncharacterized protein n=1 Tax=Sporotomaculum syntrophicum TaxID=182264 RepID=A0A9D2WPK4_9FIRM|nr:hypothetical protein SPSYN_01145 [Sporotomaculum syntrophicum]
MKERLYSILMNLGGLFIAYLSYAFILNILTISNIPQQISIFISYLTPMFIGYMLYKKYNLVIGRFVMIVTFVLLFLGFLGRLFV